MRLGQHLILSILLLLGSSTAAPAAQSSRQGFDEKAVADFYRGKTVRIIVGFSAGGGYDQYSRLIGRHLSKYIPGNPAVVVDNMPGAGSIIAANHTFNAAPKDGTVIGNISGPIILEQLFGNPATRRAAAESLPMLSNSVSRISISYTNRSSCWKNRFRKPPNIRTI